MKKLIKKPWFGGGLISDSARPQNSGKIDIHGVFTNMYCWGYPAIRAWSHVVTVFDLPRAKTPMIIGIKRKGSSEIDTLATVDIKDESIDNSHTILSELGFRFQKEGDYEIISYFKDYPIKLKTPIRIRTRDWPTFSVKEIEVLEKNKALIPHKVGAQVKCSQCNQHYVFEEKILDSVEPSGGTSPFPENGVYECDNCGHRMKLKDIQGQIRASIKDNLTKFINRPSNV
jgi:hypothetical protein